MKKNLLILFFACQQIVAFAQNSIVEQIQQRCDSILNLLLKEKDADKKADLITSFYATAIDGYPLQLLSLSQKLLNASK